MSQPETELRDAVWGDCHRVWDWNNADDVRALSTDPTPIPIDSHKRWFRARLADARHRVWIARADGHDVGLVRIDTALDNDVGVVSIALGVEARGRGIGRRVLSQACAAFFEERPTAVLHARIASGNDASTRCFAHCGFSLLRSERHAGRTFLTYCRADDPR